MAVVVALDTGERYVLDRGLGTIEVAERINTERGKGHLIPFQNDATPSRTIFIDPAHVVSVKSDGY